MERLDVILQGPKYGSPLATWSVGRPRWPLTAQGNRLQPPHKRWTPTSGPSGWRLPSWGVVCKGSQAHESWAPCPLCAGGAVLSGHFADPLDRPCNLHIKVGLSRQSFPRCWRGREGQKSCGTP